MRARSWACILLVFIALPLLATGKKLAGKVTDEAAFGQIRSYCIDTSLLPGWEAIDVRDLVKTESKPKGLLSKLPWRLAASCQASDVDAVVRVRFRRLAMTGIGTGALPPLGGEPQGLWPGHYQWRRCSKFLTRLLHG
jgi:hypothetical protein